MGKRGLKWMCFVCVCVCVREATRDMSHCKLQTMLEQNIYENAWTVDDGGGAFSTCEKQKACTIFTGSTTMNVPNVW